MASFKCSSCEFEKEVDDNLVGRKGRCPKCQTVTVILESKEEQEKEEDEGGNSLEEKLEVLESTLTRAPPEIPPEEESLSKKIESPIEENENENKNENETKTITLLKKINGLKEFLKTSEDIKIDDDETMMVIDKKILMVKLKKKAFFKKDSLVARRGNIEITSDEVVQFNFLEKLKRAFTLKNFSLSSSKGKGTVFLAEKGKKITLLSLKKEKIVVKSSDFLAYNGSFDLKVTHLPQIGPNIFGMTFYGSGKLALISYGNPVPIRVKKSLVTNPNTTMAWSTNKDVIFELEGAKSIFKRDNDDYKMHHTGPGHVIVGADNTKLNAGLLANPVRVVIIFLLLMFVLGSVFLDQQDGSTLKKLGLADNKKEADHHIFSKFSK